MFIDANEAKLYATRYGPKHAPVIVGIGGWIGSSELWAEPFAILSDTWQTIAYDHRGCGATVASVASITHENLVNDLLAVLDACGVEHCVLAAESSGAMTAIDAALRYPQRISHLVIVDGMYHRGSVQENDPFTQGLRMAYSMTLDRFIERCVPEVDSDHIKRLGRHILNRASQESAIALWWTGSEVDLRGKLSEIMQPTLVIHGDKDMIVPLAQGQALAAAIPNSTLLVLNGAGHVPTLTRPEAVANAMMEFLR